MRRGARAVGFGLAAIVAVLVACGSGTDDHACFGGCVCYSADSCPTGCYRSQTNGEALVCSNGIVDCVKGGGTWSVGTPMNNCGSGTPSYVTGGGAPSGAFCCASQPNSDAGDGAGQ